MTFSFVDLIFILIIFGFVIYGFMMGLIEAVGALVGLVLGVYLAGQYYDQFGQQTWVQIIAFILIVGITSRLVGFVFYILNKFFRFIAIIPFLKSINRLAGALLGLTEGIFIIGISLYFINQYELTSWIGNYLESSQVAQFFIFVSRIFTPLIPEAVSRVKDYI